jgi:ATP-dependent protease ClpP protease subunit
MSEINTLKTDHHLEADFHQPVSFESINGLHRIFRNAIEYEQYKRLRLNVNSPGGEFSALTHYLWYLKAMRHQAVEVATLGQIQVASAAAIMVSMGDIGHRAAYPHTEFVYHFARLGRVERLTAQKADYLRKEIEDVDKTMLDQLVEHIAPAVGQQSFPRGDIKIGRSRFVAKAGMNLAECKRKMRADLERLFLLDMSITAEQARDFYLIDTIKLPEGGL